MSAMSDFNKYYRTENATVVASDIPKGLIAYGSEGLIVGTNPVLVLDLFNEAATTNLVDHQPDINALGNVWENYPFPSPYDGGTLIVSGNLLNTAGNNYITVGVIETGVSDVIIECDVTICNGNTYGSHGLVGRFVDDENFWSLTRHDNNTLKLIETIAGTGTDRATPAVTLTNNLTYAFKLVFSGDRILGYINGVEYVDYTSSSFQTATKHGIEGIGFTTPGPSDHNNLKISDNS